MSSEINKQLQKEKDFKKLIAEKVEKIWKKNREILKPYWSDLSNEKREEAKENYFVSQWSEANCR
jgi:5-methylcytosine-specific restriction endonuclease McrBC regulatory subunit McrC